MLRSEVQSWFFKQIMTCYQDMAINFESHTLGTLIESSKAREIRLCDQETGYCDHLVVVPACPSILHIVERDGLVKSVKAINRADVASSALFQNLSDDDLRIVAGY